MPLEYGLSCFSPAPGRENGKIYYFVPQEVDLTKPAGLFIFMHGGDRNTPDTAPFDNYLSPEKALFARISIISPLSLPPPVRRRKLTASGGIVLRQSRLLKILLPMPLPGH